MVATDCSTFAFLKQHAFAQSRHGSMHSLKSRHNAKSNLSNIWSSGNYVL